MIDFEKMNKRSGETMETIDRVKQAEETSLFMKNSFPLEGRGKRFLGCDKYDDCLCHAMELEWSSFHCDGCRYENRTTDKYPKAEYIPDLIELVEGIWISALPGP